MQPPHSHPKPSAQHPALLGPGRALVLSALSLQAPLSLAGLAQPMLRKPLMTELLGSEFLALTLTSDSGPQADGPQVTVGVRMTVWSPGRWPVVWRRDIAGRSGLIWLPPTSPEGQLLTLASPGSWLG